MNCFAGNTNSPLFEIVLITEKTGWLEIILSLGTYRSTDITLGIFCSCSRTQLSLFRSNPGFS